MIKKSYMFRFQQTVSTAVRKVQHNTILLYIYIYFSVDHSRYSVWSFRSWQLQNCSVRPNAMLAGTVSWSWFDSDNRIPFLALNVTCNLVVPLPSITETCTCAHACTLHCLPARELLYRTVVHDWSTATNIGVHFQYEPSDLFARLHKTPAITIYSVRLA
jgi:hypothetical protein